MARSRNIKPGFFENDLLAEIPPLGRLLFIGLWTIADREGRLEDRPKKIKAQVLPYDDCNVDGFLSDLARKGFIQRYAIGSTGCIQVSNWTKHQQPHIKEAPSIIPAPDEHGASSVLEHDEPEICMVKESLIPDSLNLIPGTTPLPPSWGNPTPPASGAAVAVPTEAKTKKPRAKSKPALGIALLSMPEGMAQAFQRVCDAWPKVGWNYSTKSTAPRKTNLALAAERFKVICEQAPIHTAAGPLTAEDLAEATLAWLGKRQQEAGPNTPPCVPCIENFFSSEAQAKKHWQNALLEFFGVAEEVS